MERMEQQRNNLNDIIDHVRNELNVCLRLNVAAHVREGGERFAIYR